MCVDESTVCIGNDCVFEPYNCAMPAFLHFLKMSILFVIGMMIHITNSVSWIRVGYYSLFYPET